MSITETSSDMLPASWIADGEDERLHVPTGDERDTRLHYVQPPA